MKSRRDKFFRGFKQIKPKHLVLLSHLRQNSRDKLSIISKKTKIPISTLFDMLKELQKEVITKSTIILNYEKLGFHTRAQIVLKIKTGSDKEGLKKHLLCHKNVNQVYKINSGYHFLIETVHRNIKDLDLFLENINNKFNIEDKQLHYLIDEIKREGFEIDNQPLK